MSGSRKKSIFALMDLLLQTAAVRRRLPPTPPRPIPDSHPISVRPWRGDASSCSPSSRRFGRRVGPHPGREGRAHPGAGRVGGGAAREPGQRRAAVPPGHARRAAGRLRHELPPLRRRRRRLRQERALRRRGLRAVLDQHPPAQVLQAGGQLTPIRSVHLQPPPLAPVILVRSPL